MNSTYEEGQAWRAERRCSPSKIKVTAPETQLGRVCSLVVTCRQAQQSRVAVKAGASPSSSDVFSGGWMDANQHVRRNGFVTSNGAKELQQTTKCSPPKSLGGGQLCEKC